MLKNIGGKDSNLNYKVEYKLNMIQFKEYLNKRYSIRTSNLVDVTYIIHREKDTPMTQETMNSITTFKRSLQYDSYLYKLIDEVSKDKFYKKKMSSAHFSPLILFIDCYDEISENDMHFYKSMYITYLNDIENKQLPGSDIFNRLIEICAEQMVY